MCIILNCITYFLLNILTRTSPVYVNVFIRFYSFDNFNIKLCESLPLTVDVAGG